MPVKSPQNHPPTRNVIRENLGILADQISSIKPKIIVPLGNSALYALKKLYPDSKQLRRFKLKSVGEVITDTPIKIFPVYHTARLAQNTRNTKQQEKDWTKMKKAVLAH